MGHRDLREVMADLVLVIRHLVELRALPASRDPWQAEVVTVQLAARRCFSPGMRQLLDVDEAWTGGCRAAAPILQDHGAPAPSPACPLTLDDLLAADFDVAAATARIALG